MSYFISGFCVGLFAAVLGITTAFFFANPYYVTEPKYICAPHSINNQELQHSVIKKNEYRCIYNIPSKKFKGI